MRWFFWIFNIAVLTAVAIAVPYGIKAYTPVERNNKGVEALNNKNYDQAILLLSDALTQNPNNAVFRQNLVSAYNGKALDIEQKGSGLGWAEYYEKALELDPGNQVVLSNYVTSLNNQAVDRSNRGDFTGSQTLFERAAQHLPDIKNSSSGGNIRRNYSSLLTLWGAELMKNNKPREARTSFEQALALNNANAVACICLGDLLYEENDYAGAANHYQTALPLDSSNADYLRNRLKMIESESRIEGKLSEAPDPKGRFFVQYVDYQNGVTVPEILQMLNEAYDTIGKKLGIYPARTVNVKIYNERDFFSVSHLPRWAIGIFDGKVRLKVDDIQNAPNQVMDLLYHEYAHAVLAMNIKQRVPAWFHEGLAQMMEPQFAENPREQSTMREAIVRKRMDFKSLEDSFKDLGSKDDAETAYLLSKYFLSNLNSRYGRDKLLAWIKRLAAEENFEQAFAAVYGRDLKQTQTGWMQSLKVASAQ